MRLHVRPAGCSRSPPGCRPPGRSYVWVDEHTIAAAIVPPGRTAPPAKPLVPAGPKIEDNSDGKLSQARTYQDLLQARRPAPPPPRPAPPRPATRRGAARRCAR
jgi:hypothetical protein